MAEPQADFESHHIEGYALMDADRRHFSAPLVSHIEGNLWTGGVLNGIHLSNDFRYVVSLFPWGKYDLGPDTRRMEFTMYDDGEGVDSASVEEIADFAYAKVQAGKTLIHCQAGLNRSGLIGSLVLMRMGHTAREAIDLLREKRSPIVLCNQTFTDWLLAR